MKKNSLRVIPVLLAILVAFVIVSAFSYAGKATRQPIDNVLSNTGVMVKTMEEKLIVDKRPDNRKNELQWLSPCRTDKQALLSPDRVLLGAYDNNKTMDGMVKLEDTLNTTFPLVPLYTTWGSREEQKFPSRQVFNILQLGSIPVITWEPWLSEFSDDQIPGMRKAEDRDKNGMADIANGLYDSYIRSWADGAKNVHQTMFVRFAEGMNDAYHYPWGPQNNKAGDFVAAFRHVHDIFVAEGATNVCWIWGPHPAFDFSQYYPGDNYVDYVGVGALNYGTVAVWSKWWSFTEIFGNYYDSLATFKKPIMITEFGSLAKGGDRTEWYKDALNDLPKKYPLVKSVIFFHFASDNNNTAKAVDWTFGENKAIAGVVSGEIKHWQQEAE